MVDLFDELLAEAPGAERRKMFGCPCAFAKGNMFMGLIEDRMMLRLSPGGRAEFLTLDGAKAFEAIPGRPMREYVEVPPSIMHSKARLVPWVRRAHEYARSLPTKPGRGRKTMKEEK
jgi:TfoX/Sxy family transcriptional regulator of competence genes